MRNKILAGIMSGILAVSAVPVTGMVLTTEVSAAATTKITAKKVSVTVGKSKTISVKNVKKNNVKYSVTKNGIASFKCNSNGKITIKGEKEGKVTVTVKSKEGKVLGKYTVTVVENKAQNNAMFTNICKDFANIDENDIHMTTSIGVAMDFTQNEYITENDLKQTAYKSTIDIAKKNDKTKIEIGLNFLSVEDESDTTSLDNLLERKPMKENDKWTILIDGETYYMNIVPLVQMLVGADLLDSTVVSTFEEAQIGWVTFTQSDINAIITEAMTDVNVGTNELTFEDIKNGKTKEGIKALTDVAMDFAVILDKNMNELNLIKQSNGTYSITLNAKSEANYYKMAYNLVNKDLSAYITRAIKTLDKVKKDIIVENVDLAFKDISDSLKENKKEILAEIKNSELEMQEDDMLKMTYKKDKADFTVGMEVTEGTSLVKMNTKIGKAGKVSFAIPKNVITLEELLSFMNEIM